MGRSRNDRLTTAALLRPSVMPEDGPLSGGRCYISAFPSQADLPPRSRHVPFVPILLQKSAIGGARRLNRFLKPSVGTHSIGSGGFLVLGLQCPHHEWARASDQRV